MLDPDSGRDPGSPSRLRILIWLGVGAVAIFFIVTGLLGVLGAHG